MRLYQSLFPRKKSNIKRKLLAGRKMFNLIKIELTFGMQSRKVLTILKLLDWVILLNYGHLLKLDDFQFGFQEMSSTSLCSWVVYETIDQYIRNGSMVYGCLLDCTKAFDTIKHSILFQKLPEAKVPPIVVRLLINIYRKQMANVRWKSRISDQFPIRNGVRQGAIVSPILFCFYMDKLFSHLKSSGSGCKLGHYYA